MKKFCFVLLALCSAVCADVETCCDDLIATCQTLKGQCCEIEQAILLPSRARTCGPEFFAYGDFLRWRFEEGPLDYAIDGIQTNNQGTLFSLDGEWNSGFRVGLGLSFPCNYWTVEADWFRFRNRQAQQVVPRPGLTLFGTRSTPTNIDNLDSASASLDQRLDVIEAKLMANLWTFCKFDIHPYVGVRTDFIDQDLFIFYDGTGGGTVDITQKQHFWGVGPLAGLKTRWHLLSCFSAYGHLSAAFLWSEYDWSMVYVQSGALDANVRDVIHATQSAFQAGVGISMERCFFCRFLVRASLGWEGNVWLRHWKIPRLINRTGGQNNEGIVTLEEPDLSASGLVVRGSVRF